MPIMTVELQFNGTVSVSVPDDVPEDLRQGLANDMALARVLATMQDSDEYDCENCVTSVRDEYIGQLGDCDVPEAKAEELLDDVWIADDLGGNWVAGPAGGV